jgi:adenylate cyclase
VSAELNTIPTELPYVLIVDDDPELAFAIRDILADNGFDAKTAGSAQEALQTLKIKIPSLIISDIRMYGMSGLEFCQKVRALYPEMIIPIILMTGSEIDGERIICLEAGANQFLNKPLRMLELLAQAKSFVHMRILHDDVSTRVTQQLGQLNQLKNFFSPQVAELVSTTPENQFGKTHRKDVTVLFIDLRGFTSFTEKSDPEQVLYVLNEYYAAVGNHALDYQGTVGRFLGDGMMVYFNDPIDVVDHPRVAMHMAVTLRESLAKLQVKWELANFVLDFGMGIATGVETLGMIGFDKVWDYSVIGQATNMASRLCAEAKGGQILLSETFFKSFLTEEFEADVIGTVSLKGIHSPVHIHNVTGIKLPVFKLGS